jgi:amino acid transporter
MIYVVYKVWNKTSWHRLEEIDLNIGRRGDVDTAKQATRPVPDRPLTPKVKAGRLRSIRKSY